jgi:uncharacterized membrane protein YvbJ
MGNALQEVWDLSQQITEALDRNDQITVQLLLHMRAESIETAKKDDQTLRKFLSTIEDEKDRKKLRSLLNQGAEAAGPSEQVLARQAASNVSRIQKILEIDKRLNQRVARAKSVYK